MTYNYTKTSDVTIRVLIVDDSSFMRKSLIHILNSDASIEIVGTAINGVDAIQKIEILHPDVILLDVDMPIMNGIATLSHIMDEYPTPVVMLSGLTDNMMIIKSLELGAVDFIKKPSGVISYDIDKITNEIALKIKIAARVDIHKIRTDSKIKRRRLESIQKEIIVIGASTGGPKAITDILSQIPGRTQISIIVVLHIGTDFVSSFVERLKLLCSLPVSITENNKMIRPGEIYIARGDYCTTVIKDGNNKRMICTNIQPSINHTMKSIANIFDGSAIGIILTGMGDDGAIGMKAIKDAGGYTIAEDESTCTVFGMPKAAIELGCIDDIVPLYDIPHVIMTTLGTI